MIWMLDSMKGKTVDIATIVRDHVVLSIPYILVCSDECQGLCQSCGINQNTGDLLVCHHDGYLKPRIFDISSMIRFAVRDNV